MLVAFGGFGESYFVAHFNADQQASRPKVEARESKVIVFSRGFGQCYFIAHVPTVHKASPQKAELQKSKMVVIAPHVTTEHKASPPMILRKLRSKKREMWPVGGKDRLFFAPFYHKSWRLVRFTNFFTRFAI